MISCWLGAEALLLKVMQISELVLQQSMPYRVSDVLRLSNIRESDKNTSKAFCGSSVSGVYYLLRLAEMDGWGQKGHPVCGGNDANNRYGPSVDQSSFVEGWRGAKNCKGMTKLITLPLRRWRMAYDELQQMIWVSAAHLGRVSATHTVIRGPLYQAASDELPKSFIVSLNYYIKY